MTTSRCLIAGQPFAELEALYDMLPLGLGVDNDTYHPGRQDANFSRNSCNKLFIKFRNAAGERKVVFHSLPSAILNFLNAAMIPFFCFHVNEELDYEFPCLDASDMMRGSSRSPYFHARGGLVEVITNAIRE